MALTVRRYCPVTFPIDGVPVKLRVKRLTPAEYAEFKRQMFRLGRDGRRRVKKMHAADGDDQTEDQLFAQAAREQEEEIEFHTRAIDENIEVEPGEIIDRDVPNGRDVQITRGADLVRLYGQGDFIANMLALIYCENELKESEKNAFRSRLVSGSGSGASDESTPTADGSRPEAAVTSAAPPDASESEAATAPSTPSEDASSSTTAP